MTPGIRRTRLPAILLAALAALLVFAAAASAETRTGESSSVVTLGSTLPETTLVNASASYETSSGSTVFKVTTAGPPLPESEAEMLAALTTSQSCTTSTNPEALVEGLLLAPPPLFLIENEYSTPTPIGIAGSISAPQLLPVTKTVLGATTTLSVTSAAVAGAGFNCAILIANIEEEEVGEGGLVSGGAATLMSFPISGPPASPAPAPSASPAPPAPVPAPAPAPPVLSIGKLKPVTLKVGKSKLIKIKVTNTGATGTGAGSLRVQPPKGVVVKPERQQLPVLAPGKSWSVTVRVQLTAKAKKQSTLSLTAAASGVTASGSLAVKLKE
jgi:NPCBM-associated, NEW3 domain of alpha-galactosidase